MKHSAEFERIVDESRQRIQEVTAAETLERVASGAVLIDVREDGEFAAGHASGAQHIGRGVIERDIVEKHPDKQQELILYCGGGYRSAMAADSLQKMGYTNVFSMAGGWRAWKEYGAPVADLAAEKEAAARERTKEIAGEYLAKGDATGWFDALYKESAGDNSKIPWADLEPNRYLQIWDEKHPLKGGGKKAIVVGCGLGDDAKFLAERGFRVTAFDISPTAIEWAKKLYGDDPAIEFHVADLFNVPDEWKKGFDLVLEVYTIQPLPMEIRADVIKAIAGFVGEEGELLVVTRGREDDEEPEELPWPVSRNELALFETQGLRQTDLEVMPGAEEDMPIPRFIAVFQRPPNGSGKFLDDVDGSTGDL